MYAPSGGSHSVRLGRSLVGFDHQDAREPLRKCCPRCTHIPLHTHSTCTRIPFAHPCPAWHCCLPIGSCVRARSGFTHCAHVPFGFTRSGLCSCLGTRSGSQLAHSARSGFTHRAHVPFGFARSGLCSCLSTRSGSQLAHSARSGSTLPGRAPHCPVGLHTARSGSTLPGRAPHIVLTRLSPVRAPGSHTLQTTCWEWDSPHGCR